MNRNTWIFASILSALVIAGFVFLSFWQMRRELVKAQAGRSAAQNAAEQNQAVAASLKNELAENQAAMEELRKEKEAVTQTQKGLEDQMRTALESKDITISELQGKLTVNILDHIMFDSGEAVLKPEGEQVMQKIAGVLSQHAKRQVHVIGHTDNIPIRAAARSRYPSNWELSTARATAAVRFLSENAGIDPRRLGAVGYGEFRPVADNATAEGRAKNRRIAVVILSEELVGSDTASTASKDRLPLISSSSSDTNAPPRPATGDTNLPPAIRVEPAVSTNTP